MYGIEHLIVAFCVGFIMGGGIFSYIAFKLDARGRR